MQHNDRTTPIFLFLVIVPCLAVFSRSASLIFLAKHFLNVSSSHSSLRISIKSGKRKPRSQLLHQLLLGRRPVVSQCLSVALETHRAGLAAFHALPTAIKSRDNEEEVLDTQCPQLVKETRREADDDDDASTNTQLEQVVRRSHGLRKKIRPLPLLPSPPIPTRGQNGMSHSRAPIRYIEPPRHTTAATTRKKTLVSDFIRVKEMEEISSGGRRRADQDGLHKTRED